MAASRRCYPSSADSRYDGAFLNSQRAEVGVGWNWSPSKSPSFLPPKSDNKHISTIDRTQSFQIRAPRRFQQAMARPTVKGPGGKEQTGLVGKGKGIRKGVPLHFWSFPSLLSVILSHQTLMPRQMYLDRLWDRYTRVDSRVWLALPSH